LDKEYETNNEHLIKKMENDFENGDLNISSLLSHNIVEEEINVSALPIQVLEYLGESDRPVSLTGDASFSDTEISSATVRCKSTLKGLIAEFLGEEKNAFKALHCYLQHKCYDLDVLSLYIPIKVPKSVLDLLELESEVASYNLDIDDGDMSIKYDYKIAKSNVIFNIKAPKDYLKAIACLDSFVENFDVERYVAMNMFLIEQAVDLTIELMKETGDYFSEKAVN
jgi:hypothetical protein